MIATVGLIGDPIGRSLSPAMHNAAFAHHGLAERYELWPTTAAELSDRVLALRAASVRGANVTIPHKSAVLPLLDAIDPIAEAVGAVNTIVRRGDGQLWGSNTDVAGFLRALALTGFTPRESAVVVLGAGGAARAVCYGLLASGIGSLTVINRTPDRAEALLADLLATTAGDPHLLALGADEPLVAQAIADADLLVNATSAGSDGTSLPLAPEHVPAHALVVDLIYRPTPLLRLAAERGAQTQDGLEMLVQQGALAFEAWTGLDAPLEIMRTAARRALEEQL
jgi:shikimate dehydrogenase